MADRSAHARQLQEAWVEAQRLRAVATSASSAATPSQSGHVYLNSVSGCLEHQTFTPPTPDFSGPCSPAQSYSFETASGRQTSATCASSFVPLSGQHAALDPIPEMYQGSFQNFRPPMEQGLEQLWQSATDAYISRWLTDDQLESHHASVSDLLAFQVIHNDLADMIAEVGTRLETMTPPPTAAVAAAIAAPAVAAAPAPLPPPAAVASVRPPAEDWMSSLISSSSLPSTPSPRSLAFPIPGRQATPVLVQDVSLEQVTEMLLECGAALARQNAATATALVDKIRALATPDGTPNQRLAHYFVEALIAKLNGTAGALFTAIKRDKPSVLDTTLAFKSFLSTDPTLALAHHFGNSVMLETFEGAERVHIIDYGIQNGHQWPSLMQALAYRLGGPPRLRITGIELPQPGLNHDAMVKETGRRLARCAAELRIAFEYKAFSDKWEDVQIKALELRDDEVLAVSSVFRLRHLLDDSVVLSNPRRTVLERIRKMEPKVFVTGVVSLAVNAPFLMTRLQEAIPYCACYFDSFESTIPRDSPNKKILEREMLGREILNMIACEGMERRERAEAYYQWHWRLVNAGFEILPVKETRFRSTRNILKDYHEDWTIGQDDGWILSGWKGRVQHAYAAWRPTDRQKSPRDTGS